MKALISFSNFKGTLTNEEACAIACTELHELRHSAIALPLGDGGKGTFAYLKTDPQVQKKTHSITGAFGDPRTATSYWKVSSSGKQQIYLESADAIGYPPRDPERRDPLGATSRGLGEWLLLIRKDWGEAPAEVFIGLGDSAISDAGKGMLEVLGAENFPEWKITALCDVENPLCGLTGSARVFAPQKGASPEQVEIIEQQNLAFAKKVEKENGFSISEMPRGGSAGGLAAALHAYLGAELVSGSEFVLNASHFRTLLQTCDFLIVGEGKSDFQTISGKSPWAAIQLAEELGKKSILISGMLGEGAEEISATHLVAKLACGRTPTPQIALREGVRKVLVVFDYPKLPKGMPSLLD